MRYDGCDGGRSEGHGIFHYADVSVSDRRLPVPDRVDLHDLPQRAQSVVPVYFLSDQLVFDSVRPCDLFCGGV